MSQIRHRVVLAVVVGVTAVLPAAGQIDHRVDGRALDANNQIGSGGFNAPQSGTYYNAGNLIISGNVTGGRAFRGYSPIRDPSSLFLSLPTASLSGFQRDSVGLTNVISAHAPGMVSPFYAPSSTATSFPRLHVGTTSTGLGTWRGGFTTPRTDLLTQRAMGLNAGLNPGQPWTSTATLDPRFLPRPTITTTPLVSGTDTYPNLRLADSPLFGMPRSFGIDVRDRTEPEYPAYPPGTVTTGAQREDTSYRSRVLERLFEGGTTYYPSQLAPTLFGESKQRDSLTGQPLPASPPEETAAARAPWEPASGGQVAPLTTPIGGEPEPDTVVAAEPLKPAPYQPDEFAPTRESVYQDFRRAVRWSEAYREYRETTPEEPAGEVTAPSGGFDAAASYVQRLLDEAPKSFAGEVESNLNVRVRKAEVLMRKGEFYNAAAQYAIAAAQAPNDPLIRLGQGHAYLAAGDYISAVYYLTRGLERFAEVARFKLDLYEFVEDPTILDIRRADLETKLEHREDYTLRFLLGYVEYYGGLKDFGFAQLERAAAEAPRDSVIARFPKMLEITKPVRPARQDSEGQSPRSR